MDKFLIRQAEQSDLSDITDLIIKMYKEQKTFGMLMNFNKDEAQSLMLAQISSKLQFMIVLEFEGKIMGFVSAAMVRIQKKYKLENQGFIGFIHDLYVDEAIRGKGFAKMLLAEAEKDLKEAGIEYIELHVLEGNLNGRDFWSAMGYEDNIRMMVKHIG